MIFMSSEDFNLAWLSNSFNQSSSISFFGAFSSFTSLSDSSFAAFNVISSRLICSLIILEAYLDEAFEMYSFGISISPAISSPPLLIIPTRASVAALISVAFPSSHATGISTAAVQKDPPTGKGHSCGNI